MTYDELRARTNTGWNTWFSSSMTSHVLLPYGFCIGLCFRSCSEGRVIRNLKPDDHSLRPGDRSWDGACTRLSFTAGGTEITVESTAKDGEEYLLVTPRGSSQRAPVLVIEASVLWGRPGTVFLKDGRLGAAFDDGKQTEIFTTGKIDPFVNSQGICPCICVTLDEPVAVSTVPASVDETRAIIDEANAAVTAEAEAYGENAEAYRAMRAALAWNTVFDPANERIITPVTRHWSEGNGGYVLFEWDTYLAALMCSLANKELAYLNAFAITNEMTEDGFVPNFALASGGKSRDRSQPPVGSLVALRLWERFREDWFVKEIFPALYRWNTWFWERRRLPDGTFCWGSDRSGYGNGPGGETTDIGNLQGAKYESGLDNSPMYDGARFDRETGHMLLSDVGLTGLYIMDCRCLSELARIAGNEDAIPVLESRLAEAEAALETLWNNGTGIYENRDAVTGEFSHRVSPTNLYSLFSERVSEERRKLISERYILDPDEMGGEYMLPSISRSDPAFADQDYWRGRIWPPMNYLVYEALRFSGMKNEMRLLAESSRNILLREWREHGHVHENYSGIDGSGCGVENSCSFYHWGGLLGYIAIIQT
ncbi:MAG: hypothetical protein K6G90_06690 [Clostridia bacterium]|nr:hypothetical protein [Clostridia bacterium]